MITQNRQRRETVERLLNDNKITREDANILLQSDSIVTNNFLNPYRDIPQFSYTDRGETHFNIIG